MAKTKAQLITDIRQIIGQADTSNSNFTDAQLLIWLNDAYRRVVVATRNMPRSYRDYTAAASVTLNSATITVLNAKLKNPDSADQYYNLRIIGLDELLQMDPDYEAADTGLPEYLVRTDIGTAVLHPRPKSSVTALTTPLRLYATEMPTELSSDSDTPSALPPNLHDILIFYPSFRCFSSLNDEARATQQLTLFRGSLKDERDAAIQFSPQLNRWRFEDTL